MRNSVMLDTNLVIYALAEDDPEKSQKALNLLEEFSRSGIQVVMSVQALKELGNVTHRKYGLTSRDLEKLIEELTVLTPVLISETFTTVPLAVRLKEEYDIDYWDALIVASCLENGITLMITEDGKLCRLGRIEIDGRVVEFLNPFET
jgi:predicted nucleic acid-binding protein